MFVKVDLVLEDTSVKTCIEFTVEVIQVLDLCEHEFFTSLRTENVHLHNLQTNNKSGLGLCDSRVKLLGDTFTFTTCLKMLLTGVKACL